MLDQDYVLMRRMNYLSNVYYTIRKYRGLVGDQINTGLTIGERLLLGDLVEWGVFNG